ncbi:MAG: 2-iminoacetate synthase ThiH [Planctomycetes bacterium]|nr:2-iminoacetate synthase ThiH [Planctomycetota bacterium]
MLDIATILSENQLDGDSGRWDDIIHSVSATDVERQLDCAPGKYSAQRLAVLISPAASNYLEIMAQQAHDLTKQRFGRTIQLYAPLYLSNHCVNRCLYCGYNTDGDFERTRLSIEEALSDAQIIAEEGFRHILLVSGEDTKYVSVEYLAELAGELRKTFSSISIEIYPMDTDGYKALFDAGIDGITLYQETYNRRHYEHYHAAGPKRDYDFRIRTHDRAATAGMRRLGIGTLLGLCDWRQDTMAMAEHAAYLMKKYWRSQVSFSFPRLRPALNVADNFEHLVSDTEMVQMMLALRLCFADAGIVLSTRERADFRDNLLKLAVTRLSAGSKTNPGGYSGKSDSAEQFQIDDDRTPEQMAGVIKNAGMEAVWKDWDASFAAK